MTIDVTASRGSFSPAERSTISPHGDGDEGNVRQFDPTQPSCLSSPALAKRSGTYTMLTTPGIDLPRRRCDHGAGTYDLRSDRLSRSPFTTKARFRLDQIGQQGHSPSRRSSRATSVQCNAADTLLFLFAHPRFRLDRTMPDHIPYGQRRCRLPEFLMVRTEVRSRPYEPFFDHRTLHTRSSPTTASPPHCRGTADMIQCAGRTTTTISSR